MSRASSYSNEPSNCCNSSLNSRSFSIDSTKLKGHLKPTLESIYQLLLTTSPNWSFVNDIFLNLSIEKKILSISIWSLIMHDIWRTKKSTMGNMDLCFSHY